MTVTARVPVGRNPLGSAVVRGRLRVPCLDSDEVVVLPAGGHVWLTRTYGPAAWRL